ncbi:hypothetical protein Ptr902_00367 [Pyrenophora tritici-repentis]|uniref:Uncharacterized protein n=1 Tax=Pyrenophora tritici-repentis TaxID=45151 RepID=A0A834VVR0_9PLEO|nr:hypothetical protein A1F99_025570 [Pyrenophora tritici-repentis]KAF7578481.1 hypothetical protein PtrM4_027210 [Pyrenophora tritici-repentis]KAI0578553.1 hypothetical protein Alg130_07876 [Pyrenophora tritici-repentis]KAI0584740.1 hypothetical protein Alg215_02866 [Pyrenophora tritici-repentis]KAI0607867.1 hypothetical protein TUN205_07875 [Pyrenophora tritici-repentis]
MDVAACSLFLMGSSVSLYLSGRSADETSCIISASTFEITIDQHPAEAEDYI